MEGRLVGMTFSSNQGYLLQQFFANLIRAIGRDHHSFTFRPASSLVLHP